MVKLARTMWPKFSIIKGIKIQDIQELIKC